MSVFNELFSTFLNTGISVASFRFLFFITVLTVAYYIVPKKWQWKVLTAANTVFYIWGGISSLIYLLLTLAAGYSGARLIEREHEKEKIAIEGLEKKEKKEVKQQFLKKKKALGTVTAALVLSVLVVTKYTPFLLRNLNRLPFFEINVSSVTARLPVILGCSYYTLSLLAYVADVYRKKIKAEKNFLKLYVFISFFPHIIQGPISRYGQLAPQITKEHSFDFGKLKTGLILIAWGFFKKLVIADRISPATAKIFSDFSSRSGTVVFIGSVLFSLQLYADWTGYCDIVYGTAEILGIEMQKNFDRPYFSKTMPEFWRRWHISMGTFFKDYVLYPVSTSKICLKINKKARQRFGNEAGRIISSSIPILAVWLLTGLWHGGSWGFIIWGLYQGVVIILSLIFTPYFKKLNEKLNFKTDTFAWSLFRMARTFVICCIGRIFFNAGSAMNAFKMFARMLHPSFGLNELFFSYGLDKKEWLVLLAALAAFLAVSVMQEKFVVRQKLDEQPILFKWPVIIALIMAIVIFGVYGDGETHVSFVYEQF